MGRTDKIISETDIFDLGQGCREIHVALAKSDIPELRALEIEWCGHGVERTAYEIRRRARRDHQVLITVDGEGWMDQGGQCVAMTPGRLWFTPHGSAQHYAMAADRWEILWFAIPPDAPAWKDLLRNRRPGPAPARDGQALRSAIQGLHRELNSQLDGARELCVSYARQIDILLRRMLTPSDMAGLDAKNRSGFFRAPIQIHERGLLK